MVKVQSKFYVWSRSKLIFEVCFLKRRWGGGDDVWGLAYVKIGQLLVQKRVVANEVPKDRFIKQFF